MLEAARQEPQGLSSCWVESDSRQPQPISGPDLKEGVKKGKPEWSLCLQAPWDNNYFMGFLIMVMVMDRKAFSIPSLACMHAKSLQSCLTLCNPIDGSQPGSPIPGILQARTVKWVAISFPNAWKWKVKVKLLSPVWSSATPWTAAYQAPPSMGFSRQEYWSGVPLPSANY